MYFLAFGTFSSPTMRLIVSYSKSLEDCLCSIWAFSLSTQFYFTIETKIAKIKRTFFLHILPLCVAVVEE